MKIRVLYFASVRERLGRSEEELEVPGGATVGAALELLFARAPEIGPLRRSLQVAVNEQVVRPDAILTEGDELALLPPVSGGASGTVSRISPEAIALETVVRAVEGPGRGGVVTFNGVVRGDDHGRRVVRLEYEAYVPMAERTLREIVEEIEREWPDTRVAVVHRVGALQPGETAVAIAAAAPHRAEAFEACRAAIDRVKERAPIWKKEVYEDGAEWVACHPHDAPHPGQPRGPRS